MESLELKFLTENFLFRYLHSRLVKLLIDIADDVKTYLPDSSLPEIELGFKEKNEFEIIKILFLSLPIDKNTQNFLCRILTRINSNFSGWRSSDRDIQRLFGLLLKNKRILRESSLHFALEFKREEVEKIKIYFSSPKSSYILKFSQFHFLVKEFVTYNSRFLSFDRNIFGIDYYKNNRNPKLKFYLEFSAHSFKERSRFFNLFSQVLVEDKKAKLSNSFIASLIKHKAVRRLGLHFKGQVMLQGKVKFYLGFKKEKLKSSLRVYVLNKQSINKTWLAEIQKFVDSINGYYSYVCYRQDGIEVYIR